MTLLPITCFAGLGMAVQGGGGMTGWVRKAWCVNQICYQNDLYDCFDSNQDGYCDGSKVRPQQP